MHLLHNWQYIGSQKGYRWLGGVVGGLTIEAQVQVKKCTKCGMEKENIK